MVDVPEIPEVDLDVGGAAGGSGGSDTLGADGGQYDKAPVPDPDPNSQYQQIPLAPKGTESPTGYQGDTPEAAGNDDTAPKPSPKKSGGGKQQPPPEQQKKEEQEKGQKSGESLMERLEQLMEMVQGINSKINGVLAAGAMKGVGAVEQAYNNAKGPNSSSDDTPTNDKPPVQYDTLPPDPQNSADNSGYQPLPAHAQGSGTQYQSFDSGDTPQGTQYQSFDSGSQYGTLPTGPGDSSTGYDGDSPGTQYQNFDSLNDTESPDAQNDASDSQYDNAASAQNGAGGAVPDTPSMDGPSIDAPSIDLPTPGS